MEWRNPFFSSAGAIDCEINHHSLGWIPTTIPSDHAMFAELAAVAAPWVPPPAPTPEEILADERARMVCSPAQMRVVLHRIGRLADVQAIADADPEASIVWEYATQFVRVSPLISAMAAPNGFTDAEIDDLFRAAMGLSF